MKKLKTLATPLLIVSLVLLPVIFSTVALADNVPLSNAELSASLPDKVGIIGSGWDEHVHILNSTVDGRVRFTGSITFFNRKDVDVVFTLNVKPYYEDRIHLIRENYTFHRWMNTSWIDTPESITVEPGCKNTATYLVSVPNDLETYLMNDKGGLVAYITAKSSATEEIGDQLIFEQLKYKLFLTLLEETKESVIENKVTTPVYGSDVNLMRIMAFFALCAIGVGISVGYMKKREARPKTVAKSSQIWDNNDHQNVSDQIDKLFDKEEKV